MKVELLQSPISLIITISIFILISISLTILYIMKFRKLRKYRQQAVSDEKRPVSVVITAKNEHEKLKQNLPFILQQVYPKFEVVVVINESDDDTYFLLKNFEARYANLKIVNFEKNINFFKDKKFPLAIGIKSASYEHLLITSADCRPASEHWLDQMQSAFTDKKQIVLGDFTYLDKPGLFNQFLRYDAFQQATKYLAAALNGAPYTGMVQNVAYTKTLFYENFNLPEFYHIDTGNDDMVVGKAAKASNVSVQLSKTSLVKEDAPAGFKAWFDKKAQHNFVSNYYKKQARKELFLLNLLSYLFYLSFAAVFIFPIFGFSDFDIKTIYNFELLFFFFLIKEIVQLINYKKCMKVLNEKHSYFLLPLFELFMMLLQPAFLVSRMFYRGNERKR